MTDPPSGGNANGSAGDALNREPGLGPLGCVPRAQGTGTLRVADLSGWACRSRLLLCRLVSLDEAGIGKTPAKEAKAASERNRPRASS